MLRKRIIKARSFDGSLLSIMIPTAGAGQRKSMKSSEHWSPVVFFYTYSRMLKHIAKVLNIFTFQH